MNEDHCCCKDFGVTCLTVLTHPKGKLVLVNEQCDTIAYFKQRDEKFLTKKHGLREGGELSVRNKGRRS